MRRRSPSDFNAPNTSPPSARRSRWRPWLLLLAFSVAWKVIVLTLGAAVPRWVIDDSVDHIPLSMQPYANQARATALALWDGPIERRTLVRLVRVVSVDSARSRAAEECGGKSARVRATRSSPFHTPMFAPYAAMASSSIACSDAGIGDGTTPA